MHFCCFNPIPWPYVLERPRGWPFPNALFDPLVAHPYLRSQIDQLIFAEECGFDWVGVGEDHMTAFGLTPNPNLVLAILAYQTRTVRLAVLGMPLPLLNPIRVAEECALLDVISGGRLIVGFIRGAPQNYAAYNVEPDESRGRFDEASRLILKAWTEPGVFAWHGAYYHLPAVSLWPLPVQKPHPPLVYSANSRTSAIVGARAKAIVGSIHLAKRDSLARIKDSFDAYRAAALADGWNPGPDRFLIGLQTCIAETDAEAQQRLAPALNYQSRMLCGTYNEQKREIARSKPGYGDIPVVEAPLSFPEQVACRTLLCGSPRTVVDQINWLRGELGVGVISMQFQVGNLDDAAVRAGMVLFRDQVLPHFR